MGKRFFQDWELWQKMTFILACAIVGTVLLGMAKLWYDNRRVMKYNKIATKRRSRTLGMVEAQNATSNYEEKAEIPFGIRALECGIEVEGVWVSPSTTPVHGSPKSTPSTPNFESSTLKISPASAIDLPRIELPQPMYSGSYRHSARTLSCDTTNSKSRSSSPSNRVTASVPAWQRLPSSLSMVNQPGPSSLRNFVSADQTKTQSLKYTRKRTDGSSFLYHSIPNATKYCIGTEGSGQEVRQKHHSSPAVYQLKKHSDLELLHSHRLSHAAETGQLTPRSHRPVSCLDWYRNTEPQMAHETLSSPISNILQDNLSLHHQSATPITGFSGSTIHPYTNAVELETGETVGTLQAGSEISKNYVCHNSSQAISHTVVTEQNVKRTSEILRKVNSGFEILRPGTLNGGFTETNNLGVDEKRQSRKLQKKRRGSSVSVVTAAGHEIS